MPSRPVLRQDILRQRLSLTQHQCHDAAHQAAKFLLHAPEFLHSHRIAFYLPVNNELDPSPLMVRAFNMKKHCYLPVLHPSQHNRLQFVAYKPDDELVTNRYGIQEPKINTQKLLSPAAFDLVLMPLVAFDLNGNRLGMGGGYYDRTFQFLKSRRDRNRPPHLVGLAYEFQKLEAIPTEDWDVPLHKIVTETQIYYPTTNKEVKHENYRRTEKP